MENIILEHIVLIIFTLLSNLYHLEGRSVSDNTDCDPLPPELLKDILGSAYNPRYMRLELPKPNTNPSVIGLNNGKRETDPFDDLEFYVKDDFSQQIEEKPAWETDFTTIPKRKKRQVNSQNRRKDPWSCETRMKLIDLGEDYYPRYLRTADCQQDSCWYGRYTCQPKAFALRILKRRRGVCIPAKQLQKLGFSDNQNRLTEMWVWEEKAVNFCCECVTTENRYY